LKLKGSVELEKNLTWTGLWSDGER
jgi:hypothetical protein